MYLSFFWSGREVSVYRFNGIVLLKFCWPKQWNIFVAYNAYKFELCCAQESRFLISTYFIPAYQGVIFFLLCWHFACKFWSHAPITKWDFGLMSQFQSVLCHFLWCQKIISQWTPTITLLIPSKSTNMCVLIMVILQWSDSRWQLIKGSFWRKIFRPCEGNQDVQKGLSE